MKERILSNIDRESSPIGCWLWLGSKNPLGYGRIGKRGTLHRVAYEQFVGPIADGLFVLHRCDVRHCCNPEHLFLGTQTDNMRDCAAKGRKNAHKGEAHHKAKLTDADVAAIRKAVNVPVKPYGLMVGLARRYGVSVMTIHRIAKKEGWTHV